MGGCILTSSIAELKETSSGFTTAASLDWQWASRVVVFPVQTNA
jgi:hypothetical protein